MPDFLTLVSRTWRAAIEPRTRRHSGAARRRRPGATIATVSTALILAACGSAASPATSSPAISPVTSAAVPATSAKPAASAGTSAASAKPAASAGTSAASAKPAASAAAAANAKPAASANAKPAASGAAKPTLNIAYGTNSSATFSPLWLADATHAFDNHGVNVKLNYILSAQSTAALLAKEIDVVAVSANAVLTADLTGQIDEVYIGSIFNTNTAVLFTKPAIKNAADLKGKIVGSDKAGTPTDFFVSLMLNNLGLKTTDVQLLRSGGAEITTPALIAGQIDAAASTPPITFALASQGYNQVADTYNDPYLAQGYVVLRSRLPELAPALKGFLLGIQDGIHVFNDQADLTKKVLTDYSKESDPTVIQKTYDFYKDPKHAFDDSLQVKDNTIQSMLDYLGGTTNPTAKNAKPQQFYDMSIVNALK
jgi:ABC-type nitrate/sulfonate/bicarbonate transport system substrate-binding protein